MMIQGKDYLLNQSWTKRSVKRKQELANPKIVYRSHTNQIDSEEKESSHFWSCTYLAE